MSNENVLQEAERLIYGPRQASYGHPFDDFSKTGQMWGAILSDWRKSGEPNVPPELVGLCQIAVKISREVNAPKRDNVVDMAGYAGTVALVRERQASSAKPHGLIDKVRPRSCRTCREEDAGLPFGALDATIIPFPGPDFARIAESVADAIDYCGENMCLLPLAHPGPHAYAEYDDAG